MPSLMPIFTCFGTSLADGEPGSALVEVIV
jgi:hypothetical protein